MKSIGSRRSKVLAQMSLGCLRKAVADVFTWDWTLVPDETTPAHPVKLAPCHKFLRALDDDRSWHFEEVAASLVAQAVQEHVLRAPRLTFESSDPAAANQLSAEHLFEARSKRLRQRIKSRLLMIADDFGGFGLQAAADGEEPTAYLREGEEPGQWRAVQEAMQKQAEADKAVRDSPRSASEELDAMLAGIAFRDTIAPKQVPEARWLEHVLKSPPSRKALKKAIKFLRDQPWTLVRKDDRIEVNGDPVLQGYRHTESSADETIVARAVAARVIHARFTRVTQFDPSWLDRSPDQLQRLRVIVCDDLAKIAARLGMTGMSRELATF